MSYNGTHMTNEEQATETAKEKNEMINDKVIRIMKCRHEGRSHTHLSDIKITDINELYTDFQGFTFVQLEDSNGSDTKVLLDVEQSMAGAAQFRENFENFKTSPDQHVFHFYIPTPNDRGLCSGSTLSDPANDKDVYDDLFGIVGNLKLNHHDGYLAYMGCPEQYDRITQKCDFKSLDALPDTTNPRLFEVSIGLATIHSSISKRAGYILKLLPEASEMIRDRPEQARRLIADIRVCSETIGRSYQNIDETLANLVILYGKIELIQYWITPDYAKGRAEYEA